MIVIVGLVVLHGAVTVGCNGADPIGRCNPPQWGPRSVGGRALDIRRAPRPSPAPL